MLRGMYDFKTSWPRFNHQWIIAKTIHMPPFHRTEGTVHSDSKSSCSPPSMYMYIATHTIHQTDIPTLLDSWVTTHLLSKHCDHKKICFSSYFYKKIICFCVGLLRIFQVFSVSCTSVLVGYDKLLFH